MKTLKLHVRIMKVIKNIEILCENHEHHENHRIPYENQDNRENTLILYENHANQ